MRLVIAVPAGTQLTAAISPFAVNIGALITLRNEKLNLQSGSARLYGMTGKYTSVSLTYTNRDGSPGSNPNMIFARAPRTINNGQAIDLVDFSTVSRGFGGLDPLQMADIERVL